MATKPRILAIPDESVRQALRNVSDGLSPKRLRYATEKRPKWVKPCVYAIDVTVSRRDGDCRPRRAAASLDSVRNCNGVYPR